MQTRVMAILLVKDTFTSSDFQTHAIGENPLSNTFTRDHPQIITRICADMNGAFLRNIHNAEIAIVPANMMNVHRNIKNIAVKDAIFVDTNPDRQISHLQKADYVGQSTIYRPLCSHHVDLGGKSDFDMCCYNLSAVTGFKAVAAVPQHLFHEKKLLIMSMIPDDGCCQGCCLSCFGCCCKK